MTEEEGIFPHECIKDDCKVIVQYDDEPWCFSHSPDSGSSVKGFSARRGDETANLSLNSKNKPGKTWCTPHDMHPKDCFPLHNPQSTNVT